MTDNIQEVLTNAFNIQNLKANKFNFQEDYGDNIHLISISQEQQKQIDIVNNFLIDIKKVIDEKKLDFNTFDSVLQIKKKQVDIADNIQYAFEDMGECKSEKEDQEKEDSAKIELDNIISDLTCNVGLLEGIKFCIPRTKHKKNKSKTTNFIETQYYIEDSDVGLEKIAID